MFKTIGTLSLLLVLAPNTLNGQKHSGTGFDPALTTTAISLSIGNGPAQSDRFQRLYDHGRTAGDLRADLGGLSVNLAFLRRVGSRVHLGADIGVFVIGPGSLRGLSYGPFTCVGPGCAGIPTDDAGIHLGGITSLRMFSVGRLIARVEAGGGLNFFNLNEAGPAHNKNESIEFVEGTPYYHSPPGAEPYVVGRIAPAIVLFGDGGTALTLNPFASVLRTFGLTDAQSVTFGASLGILIGRRRAD